MPPLQARMTFSCLLRSLSFSIILSRSNITNSENSNKVMNKALVIGSLVVCASIWASCNQEPEVNGNSQVEAVAQSNDPASVSPGNSETNSNRSMEERGLRKLNPEYVPSNIEIPDPTPQKWAFLTSELWHYEFALTVTEVPDKNIYEGYWIDFNDDGTYTKGIYEEQTVEGVFTFNNDNKTLRIYPTKGEDKIKEWEILTNGDVIIFVGTNTFGNNSEQIKLARAKDKPKRKVAQ